MELNPSGPVQLNVNGEADADAETFERRVKDEPSQTGELEFTVKIGLAYTVKLITFEEVIQVELPKEAISGPTITLYFPLSLT